MERLRRCQRGGIKRPDRIIQPGLQARLALELLADTFDIVGVNRIHEATCTESVSG